MGTTTKTEEVLSGPAAARYVGVHINTIRNWINGGVLKAGRPGPRGNYRILKSDIDELLIPQITKAST